RHTAPRSPLPGGAWPPPTARRPRLAWHLQQYWTAPRPRRPPPPVGQAGLGVWRPFPPPLSSPTRGEEVWGEAAYRSRNNHQTGRRAVYASQDPRQSRKNHQQPQRDAGAGAPPGAGSEGQDAYQSRRQRHGRATQRDAGAGHGPDPE